jgi:hypothetical protein
MCVESKPKSGQEQTPTLNRCLRDLRHIASRLKRSRMTPLQVCEAIIEKGLVDREARTFFSGLPNDERYYWIASLYALLLPKARFARWRGAPIFRGALIFRSYMLMDQKLNLLSMLGTGLTLSWRSKLHSGRKHFDVGRSCRHRTSLRSRPAFGFPWTTCLTEDRARAT